MKAYLNRYFLATLFTVLIFGLSLNSKAQAGFSDLDPGLGYDPYAIVLEWDAWHTEATPENAFIGAYIDEFQVPRKGQEGLNRKETWYWWISHHPNEIQEYINRRTLQQASEE